MKTLRDPDLSLPSLQFLFLLCWQQVERDLNHGKQQQQLQQAHGQLQLSQFALPQDHCQPQGSAASVPSVLPQFLNMDIAIQQQQQQQQQGMCHNYSSIELGCIVDICSRFWISYQFQDIFSKVDSRKFTRLVTQKVSKLCLDDFRKCTSLKVNIFPQDLFKNFYIIFLIRFSKIYLPYIFISYGVLKNLVSMLRKTLI